ncbi:MAG TPA: ABC transporter ATP-binding protein [Herpetosiphonaceae bacterium]
MSDRSPTSLWSLLVRYVRPQWPKAALLAVLLLLGIGLELVNPQILRRFIDATRTSGTAQTLSTLAILFIGVALINQVFTVAVKYLSEDVGLTATNLLRADLTLHCLQLDMTFHTRYTPGELIERIDGDTSALANFFSQFVIQLGGSVLLLIGLIVVVSRELWQVGVLLGGFIVLTFLVVFFMQRVTQEAIVAERQATAEIYGFVEERLVGLRDIRSSGAQGYVIRRFVQLARTFYHSYIKGQFLFGLTLDMVSTLFFLVKIASLALGAYLLFRQQITIGTVVLLYSYSEMLERPMTQIMEQVGDFQKASASITRIQALYNLRSAIQEHAADRLPDGALAVEFQQVTFNYHADEPIIKNVSFELAPGTVLGILGRTGSGKTTISRLLFRLYEPDSGRIRLGGKDLHSVALADLRQRISLVTQDVQLFHATVRDNLTFFDHSFSDQQILQVFHELGLWDWYQTLPQGLDTHLASGNDLSAGEAQLLALTRAFLKNPGLVILDEASSRLDPVTEQRIERALRRLLEHRTAIIIAHRLATIEQVDEIMILHDGMIQEYGRREHLQHDPGSRFSEITRTSLEKTPV